MHSKLRRRLAVPGAMVVVVAGALALAAPAHADATISSTGPLTNVFVSSDLNCGVNHTGDLSGEFYGDTACGTFVAVGGVLYGPASVPAGVRATGWTAVSQTGVTGAGTTPSPYQVVTTVNGVNPTSGSVDVQVVETDSYVVGQEAYRTDIQVTNPTNAPISPIVYHAGDCYLQDSDLGFGQTYAGGGVACISGVTDPNTGLQVPGPRVEQFFPLTPGSSYMEAGYSQVWGALAAMQPLPNTCRCADYIDNGEGLSWSPTIAAGGSATQSMLSSFSPTGVVPLTMAKTADAATAAAGGSDGYTITISNASAVAVALDTVVDSLPAGFAYTAGSSSGATTADPTANGQTLTWALSNVSVPAGGAVTLHFGVTVSCTAGGYTNSASGTATADTVVPVTNTAPVTVTGTCTSSPDTTSLSTGTATTQYSDPVSMSATLTDTTTNAVLANTPVTFSFNGTNYPATTNSSGVATATVAQVLLAPNSYAFTVSYAGDSTHAASSGGANVIVGKEDCTLTYTGALSVPTGTAVALSAQFGETDSTHGDWSGHAVDFQITNTSTNSVVADPTAMTSSAGVAGTTQALDPGVYSVVAHFAGDVNYNGCQSSGSDIITVAVPNALVTGGGFIVSNGHVNFGFNAASAAGVMSGQLQLHRSHTTFHGSTVGSLVVSGHTATWSGTGRYNGVGGYTFTVTVTDNGSGGSRTTADTFAIQIRSPGGVQVYAATGQLRGGNITIHQL